MAEPYPHGPASFMTQADALLRKNLTFQRRNMWTNIRLISFPIILCLLFLVMQSLVDNVMNMNSDDSKCGTEDEGPSCLVPDPPKIAPLLQIPAPAYRAVRTAGSNSSSGLPDESCRATETYPATTLYTGGNQLFAGSMFLFPPKLQCRSYGKSFSLTVVLGSLAGNLLGSSEPLGADIFSDSAFSSPLYHVRRRCRGNTSTTVTLPDSQTPVELDCLQGLNLWRNSSAAINEEVYKGFQKGNPDGKINEIVAAYDFLNTTYDFLNTSADGFNVSIYYKSTYKKDKGNEPMQLVRVGRSVNLATNAFLQYLLGQSADVLFEFVKEMPQGATKINFDLSSLLGTLFFTWVVIQLFPVILSALVYEKQQKLRIMMKMHGLSDGPYWLISYAYFLAISALYMLCFVIFGSVTGLKFFTLNDYGIQFVFYFIYINLQIALAFLLAAFFSDVKTATVVGYICVFGTGLLGGFLLQYFVQDPSFPRAGIIALELYPGFSLYRGLYEFSDYAFTGNYMGTKGMQWSDVSDSANGMKEVLAIMFVEWIVVLLLAYYIDQSYSSGSGKGPLGFLSQLCTKKPESVQKPVFQKQGSDVSVQMDKADVSQERAKVEQLLAEPNTDCLIVCDDLKKVYPGRDGNPPKYAVRGLSLAIPKGECFGMLGPNGAGKTSFISMMIGLTKPSSGESYIQGLDIRSDMDRIYTSMGVCPQHDLLWETLTGREHLLFYGRLKNLRGAELDKAIEDSLKSLDLFYGGVADKQAGQYSGGMKRRLSVAISLIGDPKVVYMDEPSTGLDPASRDNLWNVVKQAKKDRAIILTTHSMEEAEALCDRLGIFVDGGLQCIGDAKELKGRYGGSYVFTMTTSSAHEGEVERLVKGLSPTAKRIYQISGTQKFEIPKHEVRISDMFQAVEKAKSQFTVYAWGLADTTLEDVFIKVARTAQSFQVLS